MTVQGLHHVAYRCNDARETTDFYTRFLDLGFNTALAENEVPSTGEWSPHIHIFFEMGDGSSVALTIVGTIAAGAAPTVPVGEGEAIRIIGARLADRHESKDDADERI